MAKGAVMNLVSRSIRPTIVKVSMPSAWHNLAVTKDFENINRWPLAHLVTKKYVRRVCFILFVGLQTSSFETSFCSIGIYRYEII